MSIPDALRATVLRRLGRLERTERGILMRASVIGRHFDLRTAVGEGTCVTVTRWK